MNAVVLPLDKASAYLDVDFVPTRGANLDLTNQLVQLRSAGRGLVGCFKPKAQRIAHSGIAKLL